MALMIKTKMPSLSCCSPVLIVGLLLVVTSPIGVSGWGKDGHELVGNLAYRLLSSSAQSAVHEILGDDAVSEHAGCYNNTPLGNIADWADQVRMSKDYHWSGVLHYIDIHDETVEGGCPAVGDTDKKGCHFDYSRDCKQDACVAGAIVNYTHHLADWKQQQPRLSKHLRGSMSLLAPFRLLTTTTTTSPPTQLVQESLKFFTHFVGDIHQPLHSGRQSDIGGNRIDVTFHIPSSKNRAVSTPRRSGRRTTTTTHHHHHLELHAVWDTSMIERAIHTVYHHSRQELEEDLMNYIHNNNSSHHDDWLACADTSQPKCTSAWAEESWQHALTWAYRNADGQSEVTPGTNLTDAYYETRWPQIFQYIAVAGVRLAAALEMVLGDDKNHHHLD